MGCLERLFYIGMTCLITYQAWYNFRGASELGGQYNTWSALGYSVGSLIPAISLGFHACQLAKAKTPEDLYDMALSTPAKLFSYLYMAVLGYMVYYRLHAHF